MPPATGLAFYRKKQTLENLSSEQPQSLQSVYTIVRDSIAGILDHVTSLEHAYYGPEGSLEAEVQHWMPIIHRVVRPARFSDLISRAQLDAIADRLQDVTDKIAVTEDDVREVYECVNKALNSVRQGMREDIDLLEKLLEFVGRYCRSFSPPEGESLLETATNYEKQLREMRRAVSINLRNILLTVDKFEKETLKIHQFDFVMKEAGEKAGCSQAAFLLIFPAACHHLRNACRGLEMWLDADAAYADYLRLDIEDLVQKRALQARVVQQHVTSAGEHEHRIKNISREIAASGEELTRLLPKQKNLAKEERELRDENHDVLVDLDIKEYRRQEMRILGHDDSDAYSALLKEIDVLRKRRPAIDRKLKELGIKQSMIEEKRTRCQSLARELEAARADLRGSRRAARKAEVEMEKIDACLQRLREILRLKTSSETLKKIFHNLPLTSLHPASHTGRRTRKDRLQSLCQIVAKAIDGDWVRLYQALLFHPPRGTQIILNDVDDICTRFMRHSMDEQAAQSLAKWRRLHIRACAEDLRGALQTIRRPDVVELIDAAMTRSTETNLVPKPYRTVRFPRLPSRTLSSLR